jgi:uncharacterized membrane protein
MSAVDVSVEIQIDASPAEIAAVMFDPEREPDWMSVVTGVELHDRALAPGARVTHRGSVLGHDAAWTTEVDAVHFPHVLALRVVDGPFDGTLRFDIQRAAVGSRVRVRGAGSAAALDGLPAMVIEGPIRAALSADLARLKTIVETR